MPTQVDGSYAIQKDGQQKATRDHRQWSEEELAKIKQAVAQQEPSLRPLADYATDPCGKSVTYSGGADSVGGSGASNRANVRMPDVGEIVLVDLGKTENGTRVHPGIVTRAWGPHCINVRVFADAGNDYQYNSVMHKSQIPPASSYAQPRPLYWYRRYEGEPIA